MRSRLRFLVPLVVLACTLGAVARADAQEPSAGPTHAPRRPLTLALRIDDGVPLDGERLRAQIERELGVVVITAELPAEATDRALKVDVPSLQGVRVSFGESERTVDLSSAGPHAIETLALVAANLLRDEASDLLGTLQTTAPEIPQATPAPAPPPAPVPSVQARAKKPERRGCGPTRFERTAFGFNLVPLVGTSSLRGTEVQQSFSLNVIGGSAAALHGFELGGIFNHESYAVCGGQIAGAVNLVNGPMEGFQLAAINMTDGRVDGAQVAFLNASSGTLSGAQVGFANLALRGGDAVQIGFANLVTDYLVGGQIGFTNVATGSVDGAQVGFVNVGTSSVDGAQGGFVNIANGTVRGAQGGFVNIARAERDASHAADPEAAGIGADGVQLGLVNTAAGNTNGLQLGLANITSLRSHGLMLGLVNVSENADAAIGALNIYLKGRTQLDTWITDAGVVLVGVEHGGRLLHNIAGAGYTLRDDEAIFTFAYGLGARVHESSALFVDVDAVGYGLLTQRDDVDKLDFGTILQLRVPIAFRVTSAFALFASPSLSISVARNSPDNLLEDPSLYGARVTTDGAPASAYIWPGVSLGARFF